MKLTTKMFIGFVLTGSASLALANPATIPDHPGYPSKGEFANDTGQRNLTVEQSLAAAAASEDAHTGQFLVDPNNARLLQSQGTDQPPAIKGPNSKTQSPMTEGTRPQVR